MSHGSNDSDLSRRRVLEIGGVTSALALAGCAGSTDREQDTTTENTTTTATEQVSDEGGDGRLVISQPNAPPDFDPVKGLGISSAIVGDKFFSTLYGYDSELELIPSELTTGMPEVSNDGTRWTIELVDDATFHNGDPVTAEDVRYSFQAPLDEGSWVASSWSMIDSMEVVDDRTLQFDLTFGYSAFTHALASMHIVPKAVREEDRDAFGVDTVVGSGPFQLEDWQENEYATLVRWDDYWGDLRPNLAEVEFVPIKEATTRVTNFNTEETGLMKDIPAKLYSTVENIDGASIADTSALNYGFISFNLNEGETTKPKVREAIDHCVDLDAVAEKFWNPIGTRQYQPMPDAMAESWDMPLDEWKEMAVGKDTDRASQLFEEAGVPDDWECTMIYEPLEPIRRMMVSLGNGIQEAGYQANVVNLDRGTFLERFTSGNPDDYNIYSLDWGLSPNPDYQIYNMYHEQGAGANQGHYWSDDEVMEMIERSRRTSDREERRQLYIDIQTQVIEQRVQLPAYNLKAVWGQKDFVNDFRVTPLNDRNPVLVSPENNVSVDTDSN